MQHPFVLAEMEGLTCIFLRKIVVTTGFELVAAICYRHIAIGSFKFYLQKKNAGMALSHSCIFGCNGSHGYNLRW